MNNPYMPPSSNLELKEAKAARPFGIDLLAALFLLFSIASTVLAYVDDLFGEWVLVLGCNVLLVVLLRGIFLGRDKARRTGVFLGFFIALLNFGGFYEASETYIDIQNLLYVAEGFYGIAGAVYLMKMKGNPFFT